MDFLMTDFYMFSISLIFPCFLGNFLVFLFVCLFVLRLKKWSYFPKILGNFMKFYAKGNKDRMISKIYDYSLYHCIKYSKDHSFSTYAKFSKLKFLTPSILTCRCPYQEVRNVSFSEKTVYILNEWSPGQKRI